MKVSMNGIVKSFGANNVLRQVDFSVEGGEICALLGENGAGKSTLMNILGGVLQPDEGTIELDGKRVSFHSPAQSLHAGIAFIHQELNLINDLRVYENMFIGREIRTPAGFINDQEERRQTEDLFRKLDIGIDPLSKVSLLDASYKQIVEISRALMMKASILIMDEPTTSLTDPEIERVFDMLRTLKKQQVGVVFISHKLREVMEICDTYAVLRDGVLVSSGLVRDTSIPLISRDMVGHDVRTESLEQNADLGEEVLRLHNLTLEPYYRNVSLQVRAGEVLGVTGLLGDGRSEVFCTVFGDMGKYQGQILIKGSPVRIKSTRQALKNWAATAAHPFYESTYERRLLVLTEPYMTAWLSEVKGYLRETDEVLIMKADEAYTQRIADTYGFGNRAHGLNFDMTEAIGLYCDGIRTFINSDEVEPGFFGEKPEIVLFRRFTAAQNYYCDGIEDICPTTWTPKT